MKMPAKCPVVLAQLTTSLSPVSLAQKRRLPKADTTMITLKIEQIVKQRKYIRLLSKVID